MKKLLTLVLLAVVAFFYLFEAEKVQQTTPVAKKKVAQKAVAIDYEGAMVIKNLDNIDDILSELESKPTAGAGTFDLTTMSSAITTEVLKAFSDSTERSLPLVAHWNVGIPEYVEAMDPMYMLSRIELGEHILVSWKLDPYYNDSISSSYYEESIKKAAELNLPLVFVLPAPESALTKDSYYFSLENTSNPNVVTTAGDVLEKLSPFGADELWNEVGEQWSSTSLMAQLQEWYPNPPLVLFVSENEAAKLSWSELNQESRYTASGDDNFKRTLVGAEWIEKYRQLHDGFKKGFVNTTWKENVKFMTYNKFSENLGESNWLEDATLTNHYINIWPLTADGATVDFILSGSKTDNSADAPHVLANNLPFMLNEAKLVNPNFAYQLSLDAASKVTEPAKYRGLTQFALWFLRPSIIRQASQESDREALEPLFQEVADSVELIHYNEQLASFWREGKLVNSGESNLNQNIPEQYLNDPRWFLLETDANPPRPWADSTSIPVWAFALVKGEEPNREWLVYAQSPEGDMSDVTVSVPGYKDILVNSGVDGSFYSLRESDKKMDSIGSKETQQNVTQIVNIQLGNGLSYFIDATNGNDINNGTSENTAWKTVKNINSKIFNPGDNILFKRGEVWNSSNIKPLSSGTKENPILFSSYGNKNKPKPILNSIKEQKLTWFKEDNHRWSANIISVHRIFKDNKELLNARIEEEINLKQPWIYTNNKLYLYSVDKPLALNFKFSTVDTVCITNKKYIIIDNLDLQGGRNAALIIQDSSNIHVNNCKIGKDSYYGVILNISGAQLSKNIYIENSIFDSNFNLNYLWLKDIGAKSSYIGSADGLAISQGITYSKIYNNYFKNWNHASIGMETTTNIPIHDNEIYNNTLTSPDIAYGGRLAISGDNNYNNNVHHNLIINTSVRTQLAGHDNHFHHNIIDKTKNSPICNKNIGQCISFEMYNGSVKNNIIEFNTFQNCEGAALKLISYGQENKYFENNEFNNNNIQNCGITKINNLQENNIYITEYVDIKMQVFKNNYIKPSLIYNNGSIINIEQFNKISSNIMGNNISSAEYGAGAVASVGSTIIYK